MTGPWTAALITLFVWWFSTGAILWAVRHVDQRGMHARRALTLASLPLLAVGIWGYEATLGVTATGAVYGAFLSALAIWGWIEIAFLTGAVTGPNLHPCPAGARLPERFLRAWGTVAYHEMLLAGVMITMWLYGHGATNTVGVWTFTVLYGARVSAKLNLFLGVPRINVEFLPLALGHLASHFRVARLNWLFPVSVTGLTLAAGCWLERLATAQSDGALAGFALLAAITALALVEHWLMVLPLPDAKLWRWMLPAPGPAKKTTRPEGHHGL